MILLQNTLQQIGLSDKEAKVYLAAIELGSAPVQLIAKKASVNRATTYVMIESLIQRGLMSTTQENKRKKFVAEPPENILALVKEEKRAVEEKEKKFASILSDIKALSFGAKEHPRVTFVEGNTGVERLRDSILSSGEKEILEFSPLEEAYKYFPPSEGDHRRVFRKKYKINLLYTSKNGPIINAREKNVERRWIPAEKFSFEGDMAVYGDKVNIIYYSPKLIGVLIEHAGVSNTLRQLFRLAWEGAEIYKKTA